jgi:replicative DNA helicase
VISETIQGLPASVDAEKSVLGGILLENGLIHEAGAVLAPDDFYLQSHRKIYTAMLGLAASGKPIELVSLGEELGSDKDSVGGMSYLSSLTDGVPRRQVIDHYYSLIREKSNLRRLANIGQQITALAIEQEETSESLCGRAQELILSVSGEATQQHAKPAKDFMLRTLSEMERQSQVDGLLGMSTGISGLDEVTSGIREGEMWVIGAMPGRGKTAVGIQIAGTCASQGFPTLIFELEMTDTQVGRRLLANHTELGANKIRNPNYINDGRWRELVAGVEKIAEWPIFVDDASELNTRQLASRARLYIRRHKVRLIVVDYLMLVDDPEEREARHRARKIANTLRRVAKDETKAGNPVSVVLLSQVRRPQDINDKPSMIQLKESGDIEAAAHVVLLLYMPLDEEDRPTGMDEIIVGKNREGFLGSIPVVYSKEKLTFMDRI